jgi:hypothetical protein
MALPTEVKSTLMNYAKAHIADEQWHVEFFSFIQDQKLAKRLGDEFISARIIRSADSSVSTELIFS